MKLTDIAGDEYPSPGHIVDAFRHLFDTGRAEEAAELWGMAAVPVLTCLGLAMEALEAAGPAEFVRKKAIALRYFDTGELPAGHPALDAKGDPT